MIRFKLTVIFLTFIFCCGCRQKPTEKPNISAPQTTAFLPKNPAPAKPRTKDEELSHQLGYTVRWGGERATEAVKSLLAHGAKVNMPSKDNGYPLSTAIFFDYERSHYEIIRMLLQHGANPNQAGRDSPSPLEMALSDNEAGVVDTDVALLLIRHGANVNQISRGRKGSSKPWPSGSPIIFLAAIAGEGKVITAMVAKGANVNARDQMQRTPLMLAIAWDYEEMDDGKIVTWLQGRYEVEAVRSLIQAGANVNARDAKGKTPLIRALSATADELKYKTRMFQIVRMLLQNGAIIDKTALKLARKKNYQQTVALLLSYQKNRAHQTPR